MNNITISAETADRKAREHMRISSTITIPSYAIQVLVNNILLKPIKKV